MHHKGRMMTGSLILFLLSGFPILWAQEHWFLAQSERAGVDSIISTSELVEGQYDGKYLYPPINLLDGDFDTTWCEADQGGSGLGESITLVLTEPLSFNEIQLVNGFASGNDYYHKNNRVAKVTLTQTAGEHFQQKQYTLQDGREDWQSIRFDLTQTAQVINFRIDEVYRGYKYDDTCFSDIRFLMDGRVIPFDNVEKIRVVQEEHSKSLLNSEKGAFLKQIKQMAALSGWEDSLYLLRDEGDEGYIFRFNRSSDFTRSRVSCDMTAFELISIDREDFSWDILEYDMEVFDVTENLGSPRSRAELKQLMGDRTFVSYEPLDYMSYGRSHTISDYKLITKQSIDYIETETIKLLKLDGLEGLYINGEYYELLNEEDLVFLQETY